MGPASMRVKGIVTSCSGVTRVAPLAVFHAHHAFAGQQIGIGAAQSGGLVGAVEIHRQMMFGRLAHQRS